MYFLFASQIECCFAGSGHFDFYTSYYHTGSASLAKALVSRSRPVDLNVMRQINARWPHVCIIPGLGIHKFRYCLGLVLSATRGVLVWHGDGDRERDPWSLTGDPRSLKGVPDAAPTRPVRFPP